MIGKISVESRNQYVFKYV